MNATTRAGASIYSGLVATLICGTGVMARGQETSAAAALAPPTRVEAAGSPIDIEQGGAAPWFGDFDGDGLADLLVGQFEGGKLRIYRNRGSNQQPRFDKFEWFRAGGGDGHVMPFQSTGFVPQLIDFDGDGVQDALTCSGDGSIVVFYRQKNGEFADGETLKKPDGLPIVGMPNASVYAIDWDRDGDLDLLLAGQRGEVSLLRNRNKGKQPDFGEPETFKVDGDPIYERFGNPAPVAADWDGDGRVDVLLGAGGGGVTWYRNAGDANDTALEEGKTLVRDVIHDGDDEDEGPKPGRNTRPCVCDFNDDGRLDLLVGDEWFSRVTPEVELSDEQRQHDASLEQKLDVLSKKFAALREAIDDDAAAGREKRLAELQLISSKMRAMRRELDRPPPNPVFTRHGQVWVYFGQKAQKER